MKIIIAFKKNISPTVAWYWKVAAKIIKWGTRSDFFHVEIAVNNKWIGAHTETGIEVHDFEESHRNPLFEYYVLEIDDLTDKQIGKFWEFVHGEVGTGYDWKGIYLTQVLHLDWESKDRWFCSEIVTKMLQMLFVEGFLDTKPNRLSPQDVYDILRDRIIPLDTNF